MWNSPSLLNAVSAIALWIAAICGGVTVVASFVGGLAANRASELIRNDAEIKIARANARAEEARLKALQIEQGLAWRELTPEQRRAFIDALRGKVKKVYNTFVGDDPEAVQYRNQIEAALKEAGVETSYYSGWTQAAGVQVLGEPGEERDALSNALREAGIAHLVRGPQPKSIFGKDFPALVIGTKLERL